jgi:hypothetical protein
MTDRARVTAQERVASRRPREASRPAGQGGNPRKARITVGMPLTRRERGLVARN